MSSTTLITILILLLIILIPLLLSYLVFPDDKVDNKVRKSPVDLKPDLSREEPLNFEELSKLLGHKKSTKKELMKGIEELISRYGKIHAKLGDLPHPDYKRYQKLIIGLCKNPQADKDVIISLDQKLRVKNPKYGLNIDEEVTKGMLARGL